MKWSIRLGKAFGIPVYMHLTFLLLLAWVGWSYWMQSKSLEATLAGLFFIIALFACVVFHEFGHALTARRFGITTRDVTLLPIGGVARLERMPDDPRQEVWVAVAGPAVNVGIAAVLFVWLNTADGRGARAPGFSRDADGVHAGDAHCGERRTGRGVRFRSHRPLL
jgi:Zn-dependent protease